MAEAETVDRLTRMNKLHEETALERRMCFLSRVQEIMIEDQQPQTSILSHMSNTDKAKLRRWGEILMR
jgi:hypothetical protein